MEISNNENSFIENEVFDEYRDDDDSDEKSTKQMATVCESELVDEQKFCETLEEKLLQWTIKHLGHMQLSAETDILQIFHSEGYTNLPKTANKLMGYQHRIKSRPMLTGQRKVVEYIYLGIKNGLQKRIKTYIFMADTIRLLIHIDGV